MGFLEDMENAFDPNKNGVAQAFQPVVKALDPNQNGLNRVASPSHILKALDPKLNGVADAFDPNKNGARRAFDPKLNGVADAFDPKKNGFNDFVHDVEDNASNFLNKLFGGDVMNKILLVVGGVALIMVLKK
jgi:hypothetical protein